VTGIENSYIARITLEKHGGDVDAAVTDTLEQAGVLQSTEEEEMQAAIRASLAGAETGGSAEQPPPATSTCVPSPLSDETGTSMLSTLVDMGFCKGDVETVLAALPADISLVQLDDVVAMLLKS
jgi:hypothetical protein